MKLEEFKTQLEVLSASDNNQAKIEKLIRRYFIGKAIPHTDTSHPYLARARPNSRPGGVPTIFSRKEDLSYPPDGIHIPRGRANYENEQLFYGAEIGGSGLGSWDHTALMEVSLEYYVKDHSCTRQLITLSRWKIKRPLHISILPFALKSHAVNAEFKRLANKFTALIENMFSGLPDEERKSLLADLEYMSDLFCDRDNKFNCYKISAAYYHAIRELLKKEGFPFDGLIYPSACTGAAGMNIVLERSVVDSRAVDLDTVIMVAMQRDPSNPMHISFPQVSNECIPDSDGRFDIGAIW